MFSFVWGGHPTGSSGLCSQVCIWVHCTHLLCLQIYAGSFGNLPAGRNGSNFSQGRCSL
jgi:hypothetical protein